MKMTGLTQAKKMLRETQNEIKTGIREIEDQQIELNLRGFRFTFELKDDNVKNFFKKLPDLIKKAHKRTLKGMADELRQALNEAMENPVWDWKGDARDIIDTGNLRDSLKLYIDSDDDIHIMYGEDYAAIVHYGGYFHPYGNPTIKQYYPGRPWVDSLLNGGGPIPQFDFESHYSRIFEVELQNLIR